MSYKSTEDIQFSVAFTSGMLPATLLASVTAYVYNENGLIISGAATILANGACIFIASSSLYDVPGKYICVFTTPDSVDWKTLYDTVDWGVGEIPPTAAEIWIYPTRTLTSISAFLDSIAEAVWAWSTRTLTSFGVPISLITRSRGVTLIVNGIVKTYLEISQYEDITWSVQIVDESTGAAIDLTDYTTDENGTFKMICLRSANAGATAIIPAKDVTITNAVNGMISPVILHSELDIDNGKYKLEFYGTKSDGSIRVFGLIDMKVNISIHPRS